jgi:hypothetical protein
MVRQDNPSLDNAYYIAYNAGMNSLQYTIRSIPPKLDSALRRRAQKTNKSLNEVVIEALEKGTGVTSNASFSDMDWFIGVKSLDSSFDDALDWLDNVPKDIR